MPPGKNEPIVKLDEVLKKLALLEKKAEALESQVSAIPTLTTRLDTAQALVKDLQDKIDEIKAGALLPDGWRAARVTKFGHVHPIDETPDFNGDDKTTVEEAIAHARKAGKRFNDEVIAVLPVWNH